MCGEVFAVMLVVVGITIDSIVAGVVEVIRRNPYFLLKFEIVH